MEDKLKKAKAGWNYLWNLLEKETKKDNIKAMVLHVLYQYQVELDATNYKLENIERRIKDLNLSTDDIDSLNDAISMHITNFQAIAFSIENLLKS